LIQLNFQDGIGDITYINSKGELVVIEIKRTYECFVDKKGTSISSYKAAPQPSDIALDIVKLSFIAAGREFWNAIIGLKGNGKYFDKSNELLDMDLFRTLRQIEKERGKIKINAEFVGVTTYRKLGSNINKKGNLHRLPYNQAPIIGFYLQRVNINEFIEKGKNITWRYSIGAKKGKELEIEKEINNTNDIGEVYATILTNFITRRNKKVFNLSTMVLFDLFRYLKDNETI
jgi:hypothetical protein